jgi:glc operon protein GlcG
MYTIQKVSSKEAQALINAVIAEAEPIAFLRMDEASPAASVIAQNKAYTSARDRKSTRKMGEFMLDNDRPPAFWGDKGITGFGGGLPIVQNNKVIGGIGISGLSEDEDERIAAIAIQAVYKY